MTAKTGQPEYKSGDVETIHALDWIKHAIGEEGIANQVKNSLSGLKIANYYGCMYTRPRHIFSGKRPGRRQRFNTNPHFMDDLLRAAGAQNHRVSTQDCVLRRSAYPIGLRPPRPNSYSTFCKLPKPVARM